MQKHSLPSSKPPTDYDVICIGMACYDETFLIDQHPQADEKTVATDYQSSGGGPAANAAITVARLEGTSAFVGYLGNDVYGEQHLHEFIENHVDTTHLVRGDAPTALSVILVKPDGKRALVSYKGDRQPLTKQAIQASNLSARCALFDGHEPHLSPVLAEYFRQHDIPTVLDAGSVHDGTLALLDKVDYLVCSQKFAKQYAQTENKALQQLAEIAKTVIITLGEHGLIWKRGQSSGNLPAYSINAVDTTGAGDAFHGAFAMAVAQQMGWQDSLQFASATAALCCQKTGARQGLPSKQDVEKFMSVTTL